MYIPSWFEDPSLVFGKGKRSGSSLAPKPTKQVDYSVQAQLGRDRVVTIETSFCGRETQIISACRKLPPHT